MNYSIIASGGPGINIENTKLYFVIENNTVTGTTNINNGAYHFLNVTNGVLINNTAEDSCDGFYIDSSSNITLTGNYSRNTDAKQEFKNRSLRTLCDIRLPPTSSSVGQTCVRCR